jgi:outer membrane receptor protein involved in Fe transport
MGGPVFEKTLGNTKYVFTASYYQKDFDQAFARNRNQEYYLAAKHTFGDGSSLFLSAECFLQVRHSPNSAIPMITDAKGTASAADDTVVGYAYNLGKYNSAGPNSQLNRGNNGFTVTYEKKINSVWSDRTSANLYAARRWDFNFNQAWGAIIINGPVAANNYTSARGAQPTRGRIYEDGGGFQNDLLAQYWTNDRKMEHRTLFTIDINDYYRYDPTRQWAGTTDPTIVAWNAVRTVKLDTNFNPIGDIAYFPKGVHDTPGEIPTRNSKRRTTVLGASLRQQTAMFDGRLLSFAGVRFDSILYRHRDFLTPAASFVDQITKVPFIPSYQVGQEIRRSLNQTKPNAGLNYKVTPNFRVFANYAQSWFVNQGDNPIDIADPTYKTETAAGYDYGFKGSVLNNRLSYTLCGFYSTRQNVSVTGLQEVPPGSGTFVTVTTRQGDQRVRGLEADATWTISKEFFVTGSYGTVNSIYTDFGDAFPAAIGRKVQFVAPYNGSLSFKYSPETGLLKGFSANLGYTVVGATPTETPNAGDTYVTQAGGKRVITSSTGQWALKSPAYGLWNLGVRYRLAGGSRYSHTFAVNVNNLSDEQYFRAGAGGSNSKYIGDHRAFFFTYTLGSKRSKF